MSTKNEDILKVLEEERERLEAHIEMLQEQDPTQDGFRDRSNTDDDDAAESEDFNRYQSLIDSTREQLRVVERAIAKVHEGTYGQDDLTGQPIPEARLEAIPWAIYTVESEEKLEEE